MKILIIGSGGREHALLEKVAVSQNVEKIFVAPGNAGMAQKATCLPIPSENIEMLASFAKKEEIDLTIVGPEQPLSLGVVDAFEKEGLKILGPSQKASQIEASKVFTKDFCQRHDIPTADFQTFVDSQAAKDYIKEKDTYPIVIKVDGLAAGKGVMIVQNYQEAKKAIQDIMLYEKFGEAGRKIVIEDFLQGEEASFIVLTDGEFFVEFPVSQDHKRAFDGDLGPNTGGMGAYAPAPLVNESIKEKIRERIIKPTLKGLKKESRPYKGFLYAGLMITENGDPYLIEYNCRLGDPEAQVILPLLCSDFVSLCLAAIENKLADVSIDFANQACVGVVLASQGYPGAYEKGFVIQGLETIEDPNVMIFHAGTKDKDGQFVTSGGRVLVVSAMAATLPEAIEKAYEQVDKIQWEGVFYRKDIARKAL